MLICYLPNFFTIMQSLKRCSVDSILPRHKGQDESMVGQSVVRQQFRGFRLFKSHLVTQSKVMLGAFLHPLPSNKSNSTYTLSSEEIFWSGNW